MYLLFAGICTRNCEYHSCVYFVNFLQTQECHSYLYTRQSNHFYPFLCMFSLSQTNFNHAKLQHQISCFHIYSSNLCPVGSVLCKHKKCQICKTYQLKSVFTSPGHCNFSICKWSKNLAPDTFRGKIRARMQRTSYIWNTDPSNLAPTKSQIYNNVMVPYISRKKTIIIFFHKIIIYSILCLIIMNMNSQTIFQNTVWNLPYP